ncbi:MAG: hypothetical protein QXH65_05990 [Thermofilaceae archaeon]
MPERKHLLAASSSMIALVTVVHIESMLTLYKLAEGAEQVVRLFT